VLQGLLRCLSSCCPNKSVGILQSCPVRSAHSIQTTSGLWWFGQLQGSTNIYKRHSLNYCICTVHVIRSLNCQYQHTHNFVIKFCLCMCWYWQLSGTLWSSLSLSENRDDETQLSEVYQIEFDAQVTVHRDKFL